MKKRSLMLGDRWGYSNRGFGGSDSEQTGGFSVKKTSVCNQMKIF